MQICRLAPAECSAREQLDQASEAGEQYRLEHSAPIRLYRGMVCAAKSKGHYQTGRQLL